MVYGGHLTIVPGNRDRVPTCFGDTAAIIGIASPVNAAALLERLAYCQAVELIKLENRPYRLVFGIHNEAGFPVLDDLGNRPAAPSDHRRSTSHGFDQHQTKRLGPIDREQESIGISEESGLFAVAYLPNEFNHRIGQ